MVRLLSWTTPEVLARKDELRPLTQSEDSDMSRLLDALERGEDPLLACVVALSSEGSLVGWAICEKFATKRRTYTFLSIFIAEAHRCKGIGTAIGKKLLEDVESRYPGTTFDGFPGGSFWLRLTPLETP